MGAPWTRDGTVRAYVVTMAPEVAGRIVELPVADNKYVHKGDLLMVIDPTNYHDRRQPGRGGGAAGAGERAEHRRADDCPAGADQRQPGTAGSGAGSARVRTAAGRTLPERWRKTAGAPFKMPSNSRRSCISRKPRCSRHWKTSTLAQRQIESLKAQRLSAEASVAQANAQLHQAQVNLERTRIVSPVDGYVTNLLAQLGDYVNVGVNTISVVDANSFWVDGYFEETNLAPIRVGDPAEIKLMGHSQIVRGHVDSIARAINVANAQPNRQGVATVNPIFTWVRLAQRIPVRIHIDRGAERRRSRGRDDRHGPNR